MPDRELTEEDELEAAARYKIGASIRQLAQHFDTTRMVVWRALDRQGVPRRTRTARSGRPDVDTATIVRLREVEGLTFRAIGKRCGMSDMAVRKRYARRRQQSVE